MRNQLPQPFSRRRFLGGVTLAGTAGLLGWYPRRAAAEPPPETTRLRLVKIPSVCLAPQYVAEEFLRVEGFLDVQYLNRATHHSYTGSTRAHAISMRLGHRVSESRVE
jgi:NitT/TauT family transport system substrate-binding protein